MLTVINLSPDGTMKSASFIDNSDSGFWNNGNNNPGAALIMFNPIGSTAATYSPFSILPDYGRDHFNILPDYSTEYFNPLSELTNQ